MATTLLDVITEDYTTGERTSRKIIKRTNLNKDTFFQAYTRDLGVLLKCTKGQIDLLIGCMHLQFVSFDTNELLLTAPRRKMLSELTGIKLGSIYNLLNGLKKKNIIVTSDLGREYLNPNLFFFGSEIERLKMLELKIQYTFK